MNDQKKPNSTLSLAQIQVEAAKRGVKVIDGSARFKAIGIVGGSQSRLGRTEPQAADIPKKELTERSVYHEAGHAVAAFILHLSMGRKGVTILPSHETLGSAHILTQFRENPECPQSGRTHLRMERLAIFYLSGDEAERKFSSSRRFGGHDDLHNASDVLGSISTSDEVCKARLRLARLEACDLVNCHWELIEAVATALLERKTLTPQAVRKVIEDELKNAHE